MTARRAAKLLAGGLAMAMAAVALGGSDDPTVCMPGGDLPAVNPAIFDTASPPAREIERMAWLVMGICAGIFVVVEGLLVYSIVKFRRKAGEQGEPVQLYGSNPIELAWTVVPLLIVFTLGLVTIRVIRDIERTEPPEGAMQVTAIGHQWWWEYRYVDPAVPGGEIVVANELVVPVGRPVWLRLESADVIHSWWVPALAGKTDLVPNQTNHTWFVAEKPGLFLGQCAEYCGNQHAGMLLRVSAVETAAFESWLAAQAKPPVMAEGVAQGRDIFLQLACSTCHAVRGLSEGAFAPDLTHLASRQTIASGMFPLNRDNLRAWLDDPQAMKPQCNMPSLKLDEGELDALTDYLLSLK
jgi:cytochrome c oxidase subunit 2